MLIEETEYGKIVYRLPNLTEGLRLLALCGVSSKKLTSPEWLEENELTFMADLIDNIEPYIVKIDVKIGEVELKTFIDLLSHAQMKKAILGIAKAIMESLGDLDDKKK